MTLNQSFYIFQRFKLFIIASMAMMILTIPVSSATENHQIIESKQMQNEVETTKKNSIISFREIENKITTLNESLSRYNDELNEIKNDQSITKKLYGYIPALATLFATFIGAGLAFLIQNHARAKEKREKQLTSANLILYILNERLITIRKFKDSFVEPIRNNSIERIQRPPLLNFYIPKSEFDISEVAFLLNKQNKNLVLDLFQANETFHDTVNSINKRTEIHINEYQTSLSSEGYKMGGVISEEELKKMIGEKTFEMLDKTSKILIMNIDKFLEINNELKPKLISAFSEIFTEDEILDFNMLDIQQKEFDKISFKIKNQYP